MYKNITLGFEFEVEGNVYDLIDNSAHITGITDHYIEEYHDTRYKTAEGLWRVEEDETISGAEFISPPKGYYEAKELCKAFFETIKNTPDVKTTYACGLHVGMSINGNLDNVDLTSIIPNINYRLLAKLWPDRMLRDHNYCNSLKNMLKRVNIFGVNTLPSDTVTPSISSINEAWLNSTHAFIKIKHYENTRYIEFRVPGGHDYHLRLDDLFVSIDHISDILLGHTKLSKKKTTKKMYSYLNRVYKKADYTYFRAPQVPEIFLKNKLSIAAFNTIYTTITSKLINIHYQEVLSKEKTKDELNNNNYLYCLLEYMVANQILLSLEKISNTINNVMVVSIPKNRQQSDMIKMLKLWPILPRNLVRDFLNKLNRKAYNHFIKYHINNTDNQEQRNWVFNVCKHELNNINPM